MTENPQPDSKALQTKDRLEQVETALADATDQLADIKAERKQERFFWVFAIVIISVSISFSMISWGGIVIALLALIMLLCLSHWLEVPFAKAPLERCLSYLMRDKDDSSEIE